MDGFAPSPQASLLARRAPPVRRRRAHNARRCACMGAHGGQPMADGEDDMRCPHARGASGHGGARPRKADTTKQVLANQELNSKFPTNHQSLILDRAGLAREIHRKLNDF